MAHQRWPPTGVIAADAACVDCYHCSQHCLQCWGLPALGALRPARRECSRAAVASAASSQQPALMLQAVTASPGSTPCGSGLLAVTACRSAMGAGSGGSACLHGGWRFEDSALRS